jgi:hypothetical protein
MKYALQNKTNLIFNSTIFTSRACKNVSMVHGSCGMYLINRPCSQTFSCDRGASLRCIYNHWSCAVEARFGRRATVMPIWQINLWLQNNRSICEFSDFAET